MKGKEGKKVFSSRKDEYYVKEDYTHGPHMCMYLETFAMIESLTILRNLKIPELY